jgi:hypothetical protein
MSTMLEPQTRQHNEQGPMQRSAPPSEPQRVCSQCGGVVEVITVTRRTSAGRQLPAKIGACVRCAQWFNEAGLGELTPQAPSQADE